jgi:hypothetical protein
MGLELGQLHPVERVRHIHVRWKSHARTAAMTTAMAGGVGWDHHTFPRAHVIDMCHVTRYNFR